MSLELYRTRLFWNGVTGAAKDHGKVVSLIVAPVLPGLPGELIIWLDWAPFYYGEIQRLREARREMRGDEVAAVRELLAELTR